MADPENEKKASNAEKKTDGKCPDGYLEVWVWCFKKSAIDKLPTPLDNVKLPDFTDISCESAIAALKAASDTLNNLLKLPSKYAGMLKSLVNYPFDVAQKMVDTALSAIDQVSKAINDLLSGPSALKDLESALNNMLACSYLADSEIGKLAASILDALKSGTDITSLLSKLKSALSSAARDALNNLKKTPTDAINNLQKAVENILSRLGISDIVKELKKLEKCVSSLCKAYENMKNFKDKLPTSVDDMLSGAGAKWDSFTQKVTAIPTETGSKIADQAKKVAEDAKNASEVVKFNF